MANSAAGISIEKSKKVIGAVRNRTPHARVEGALANHYTIRRKLGAGLALVASAHTGSLRHRLLSLASEQSLLYYCLSLNV